MSTVGHFLVLFNATAVSTIGTLVDGFQPQTAGFDQWVGHVADKVALE
jgi:hypothetical protein